MESKNRHIEENHGMNKVLESYVKYLLENTALPMHSNLRTKKEKRINNVVSG